MFSQLIHIGALMFELGVHVGTQRDTMITCSDPDNMVYKCLQFGVFEQAQAPLGVSALKAF